MSGISSRHGKFGIAKQTAKGSPASAPTHVYFLAGAPSLGPVKERGRFAMTDSSRDAGDGYTSGLSAGGDVPLYWHPDAFSLLAYLALGANADSGSADPWTHTATPADDLPWFTCWRSTGKSIFEKFTDCKMGALKIDGQAGQPPLVTLSILGITAAHEAAEMTGTAVGNAVQPYIFPEFLGAILFDTVAQKIHRLSWGVDNGISPYQADDYFPFDIDPGGRTFTLSFATRFQGVSSWPGYKNFFYADANGVIVPQVSTHAFDGKITRSASRSVQILHPEFTYSPFVVNSDPGGAPLEVEIVGEVERPASGEICSVITKDATATL